MKTNHIINRFLRACESYERRFDDWEHSGCCLGCIFVVSVTTALYKCFCGSPDSNPSQVARQLAQGGHCKCYRNSKDDGHGFGMKCLWVGTTTRLWVRV